MLRDGTVRVMISYGKTRHEAFVDASLCAAQIAGACGLVDGTAVKVILKGRLLVGTMRIPHTSISLVLASRYHPETATASA